MQESDCSLARSAPVLPAWSGSRGTWTACLLSPGKQALPARCSLATTLSAVTASTSSSSSLEDDALCWPASFRLPRAGSACAGKGRRESVVCCSSCRHTTSRAQQGGPTTRGTWTRDGKRRQAGPLWGLPRLSTCPPGASEVVSHRPGHHVCPHLVTRELSSSWTANTSLPWAFQEEVASSDLGGRRPKGGNVCWLLGISVLRTRPVFPTDVPRSQHKVANHVAVCYSTDVFYQANKYC